MCARGALGAPWRVRVRARRATCRSACRRRRPCRRSCPSAAASPSTSRMSSTIWKASPIFGGPALDRPRARRASAPAMIAPPTADARMSAPVFCRCIARRESPVQREPVPIHLTGRLKVDDLSADHADRSGCRRHRANGRDLPRQNGRVVRLSAHAPSGRRLQPAGRHPRGSRCRRRRPCAGSAGRGAGSRCPSPAGRRESANRCG